MVSNTEKEENKISSKDSTFKTIQICTKPIK